MALRINFFFNALDPALCIYISNKIGMVPFVINIFGMRSQFSTYAKFKKKNSYLLICRQMFPEVKNTSFMENFAFILDRGSLRSSFWKFFGMINIVFMKFVITFWWVWDGFYVARTNPCFTTKRGYWFCVGVTLKIYIYKWINFTINKLSIY